MIKLNLGSGPNPMEGFTNVDIQKFKGVDKVVDLTKKWPWTTSSVDEVECSHMLEHLTTPKRTFFVNELWRVMKIGTKAKITSPHWASARAYGDPTHEWPPISEWFFSYLNKEWREREAQHTASLYKCNFDITYGYRLHPDIGIRSNDFQQFAVGFYKEAAQDIVATLTKLK